MIKLFASGCIEASAKAVWASVAKLEDLQLWSEPVLRAKCDGALSQGVGAERTCEITGTMRRGGSADPQQSPRLGTGYSEEKNGGPSSLQRSGLSLVSF